jgi:hypothetical protein
MKYATVRFIQIEVCSAKVKFYSIVVNLKRSKLLRYSQVKLEYISKSAFVCKSFQLNFAQLFVQQPSYFYYSCAKWSFKQFQLSKQKQYIFFQV